MNHRKYNSKKKAKSNNLIDFEDFVRYRSEKERIINVTFNSIQNPFEENWKKAIVFQELIELYKSQENHFTPVNSIYDRRDFDNFYRHKVNIDEEDSMWETNEDYQI
jgi:hypothetical protein